MKKYITIIGNVGSGKSTATPLLVKELDAVALHADELFQTEDPFRDVFLADKKKWAFVNELWLTVERAKMLREHQKKTKGKLTVIDSGLLMSWVYAHSLFLSGDMTKEEWEFYERLYEEFTTELFDSLIVVHLDYSFPTLMQRIKKRERDYEIAMYRIEYFEALQKGLEALRKKLDKQGVKVVHIPEENASDFENNPEDAEFLIAEVKKHM